MHRVFRVMILPFLTIGISLTSQGSAHATGTTVLTGTIAGAEYQIEVPANWNGTLFLWSHGYVPPGSENPADDAFDPTTHTWLLDHGYALAGSSYSGTGWAVAEALHDQVALLDYFVSKVGKPQRVVAWGAGLGGIDTAGLVQQFPERFSGALAMCGPLAGGVGTWNEALDSTFAFKMLLAPRSRLQLVHIANPDSNLRLAEQILGAAARTAKGRARLALSAALVDIPGWFDPATPEPAPRDFRAQILNQVSWLQDVDLPFLTAYRAELEQRAGGDPSWNTGVDYAQQLAQSVDRAEVQALYRKAKLSLNRDLQALARAPRITADQGAVAYLAQNIVFNGQLKTPILTLHTTGDGLVTVQHEQAYASAVQAAGNERLLRQLFVHRAGDCAFTPAEAITAFQVLLHRLGTGQWEDTTNDNALNREATDLGPDLNPTPPAFVPFTPSAFLRPYDTRQLSSPRTSVRRTSLPPI